MAPFLSRKNGNKLIKPDVLCKYCARPLTATEFFKNINFCVICELKNTDPVKEEKLSRKKNK